MSTMVSNGARVPHFLLSMNKMQAVGIIDKKSHRLKITEKDTIDLLIPPNSPELNNVNDGQWVLISGDIWAHPVKNKSFLLRVNIIDLFPGDAKGSASGMVTVRGFRWEHFQTFASKSFIATQLENKSLINIEMPLDISRWERTFGGIFGDKGAADLEITVSGCSRLICRVIGDNRSHRDSANAIEGSNVTPIKPNKNKRKSRKSVSPSVRRQVMIRDGFKCQECGAMPSRDSSVFLEIDHIFPVAKGGSNDVDNLQILCDVCNCGKRDKLDSPKLNIKELDDPWSEFSTIDCVQ